MTDVIMFPMTDCTIQAHSFKDWDLTNDMVYECTMTSLNGLDYDLYYWTECDEWLCVEAT